MATVAMCLQSYFAAEKAKSSVIYYIIIYYIDADTNIRAGEVSAFCSGKRKFVEGCHGDLRVVFFGNNNKKVGGQCDLL